MTVRDIITPRRLEVLEIVMRHTPDGISASSLGRQMQITAASALEHLRKLRKLGLVGSTADGRGARWTASGCADRVRAAREAQEKRHRAADPFEAPVIKRTVRAADCAPVRGLRSSVFAEA